MFYLILMLLLAFSVVKNVFWLLILTFSVLSLSLIKKLLEYAFVITIVIIDEVKEMFQRKKSQSAEIKGEKDYDKTDPYWELQKILDEPNAKFKSN
jgi:hypothetical protein